MTVWDWLEGKCFDPRRIVLAGDSCGAVLIYGVLQRLRAQGRPLPVATLVISGWFDMALTGASYETNRKKDPAFAREAVDWLAEGEQMLVVDRQYDEAWRPAYLVRVHATGGVIDRIADYYACPWIMEMVAGDASPCSPLARRALLG